MSVGTVLVRTILVVLNLSIVGIVAVSAYSLATENFEVDFDPDALAFNMDEEEISISFPFSVRFGGYWDIEDFYYSYYILDNNDTLMMEGGQGPMLLRSGINNNLLIQAGLNTSQLLGLVDEDLILNGTNLAIGVELGAQYMADLMQFSFALDLRLPIEPIFTEFELDESSLAYDNNSHNMSFTVNHTASEMFHDFEFPLAVQLANASTALGWGTSTVYFSAPNTTFSIEVNDSALPEAIASGDMIFLRFGLLVSEEEFGPSFTMDLFQLNGYNISNESYNSGTQEFSFQLEMDTFSAMGGSVDVTANIDDGTNDFDSPAVSLALNAVSTETLEFDMSSLGIGVFGPDYTLTLTLNIFEGIEVEMATSGSIS
ncbi:MAG: hypothetical protein AB7E27_00985 [Candidatus Methanomethylophilaceae archaeon]